MTERGDKANLHAPTQRYRRKWEAGIKEDEERVRSGGQEQSVYEAAKAASDTTECRLFSHRHWSKLHHSISHTRMQQHLQGCINHTTLVTEPAYPAHHEQLPPHPLLR